MVVAGQGLDLVVIVVDGLAAGLDVQPVGERQVQRVHPAADPMAGFEDDHLPTSGTQRQCCRQPGEPGPHHGHPPL